MEDVLEHSQDVHEHISKNEMCTSTEKSCSMAATIKDIARAAGVSRGTVDRVINGRGGVKPELAEKIRRLVEEMSYRPNRAGKVLAALKKPVRIGCFLPGVDNGFFGDIIRGFQQAERELSDFGVSLEFSQVKGFDPETHSGAIRELASRNVAGLCVSTVDVPKVQETLNSIIEQGIPVIAVNSDLSHTRRLCYVGCNYRENGRTAAGILSLLGKSPANLLIMTGSLNMQGHNQRISGFLDTLREKAKPFGVSEIYESGDDEKVAYAKTLAALERHPEVNCLYITSAGVSGACRAVKELNLAGKMTILTFDCAPQTKQLIQEGVIAATICQEPFKQGYDSVQLFFEYFVNGKVPKKSHFYTDTVIKIRENL